MGFIGAMPTMKRAGRRLPILAGLAGWLLVVLSFSSLWYAYDAGHGVADPQLFSRGVGLSNTRRLEQLYAPRQALDLFNLKSRGICVQLSIPARELALEEGVPPTAVAH
jgi:hypothetical protein